PLSLEPAANISSVVSTGNFFYAGYANGITEFGQSLVLGRSWDRGRADFVQDGASGFLLTSSGSTATLWALNTLGAAGTATFRAPVVDAVLAGSVAYAVLNDRTLWSANFGQSANPAPQQVQANGMQPVSIARSGSAIAIADIRADGSTLVALLGGS